MEDTYRLVVADREKISCLFSKILDVFLSALQGLVSEHSVSCVFYMSEEHCKGVLLWPIFVVIESVCIESLLLQCHLLHRV